MKIKLKIHSNTIHSNPKHYVRILISDSDPCDFYLNYDSHIYYFNFHRSNVIYKDSKFWMNRDFIVIFSNRKDLLKFVALFKRIKKISNAYENQDLNSVYNSIDISNISDIRTLFNNIFENGWTIYTGLLHNVS